MKNLRIPRVLVPTIFFALALALVSCSGGPRSSKEARKALAEKRYGIVDSFTSKALAVSALKENATRPIQITLPPSYYANPKLRYPVLYFLHGHSEGPGSLFKNGKYIAKLMADKAIPEMIIVEPDGSTRYGGGFYANSPMTGNYEDYLTGELIAFIDANYRTIPEASARGIAGFSMGGFGALARAMGHPDLYGAVYAFAPGVLAPEGLPVAMEAWNDDAQFLNAYASVFSPTPGAAEPGRIPRFDGTDADRATIADWYSGFGDWDKKIAAYRAKGTKLKAIKIAYGRNDEYRFIREGCEYLHDALDQAGIAHEFSQVSGGHRLGVSLVVEDILPFIGAHLATPGLPPSR
ncbi:MAG TPA: alpha/beta hydrolase-fold protein [Treponemataceae bacterium]|nr:alpha/beta hydrolase-fold protein [Treponemataceae bacterium]